MKTGQKKISYVYGTVLFMIVLSGFGQMPIFSRYYIADIPGLGWLGEFYTTHILHYTAAGVLIALVVYSVLDFFFQGRRLKDLTFTGFFKAAVILGLILSGGLMVAKNFPGIYFNHTTIIVLDLVHLGLCMALLMVSLYTLIQKKNWVK